MGKEILSVPESKLGEVIKVILVGLTSTEVSRETEKMLNMWCKEEADYLKRIAQKEI